MIDLAYSTVPQTSFSDPMFDLQSNLPRVVALMEELKHHTKLRRFMVVSSGGTVYGHATQLPISEYAQTEPVSPYGITKLTIERYALMYHRLHDLPVVLVRPANAYGLGQQAFKGQGFIATAIGSILQGKQSRFMANKERYATMYMFVMLLLRCWQPSNMAPTDMCTTLAVVLGAAIWKFWT